MPIDSLNTTNEVQKMAPSHTASCPSLPNSLINCCQIQGSLALEFAVMDFIMVLICRIVGQLASSTMHDVTKIASQSWREFGDVVNQNIAARQEFLWGQLLDTVENIKCRKSQPVYLNRSINRRSALSLPSEISISSPSSSSSSITISNLSPAPQLLNLGISVSKHPWTTIFHSSTKALLQSSICGVLMPLTRALTTQLEIQSHRSKESPSRQDFEAQRQLWRIDKIFLKMPARIYGCRLYRSIERVNARNTTKKSLISLVSSFFIKQLYSSLLRFGYFQPKMTPSKIVLIQFKGLVRRRHTNCSDSNLKLLLTKFSKQSKTCTAWSENCSAKNFLQFLKIVPARVLQLSALLLCGGRLITAAASGISFNTPNKFPTERWLPSSKLSHPR